jgi:N-acetylglucosaminyldiphosphoundecaprenol N-acetyl-beta-D-mannosaminyltransferase
MVARLRARHPGLDVRGHADGYFRPGDEQDARVRAIAESGAHILLVGMGVPRQEQFLDESWEQLGVRFAIGVGGSFDVLTGRLKRAPERLQRVGLEWAYRLAQEPSRLWKRYLVTNTQFLWLLARRLVRGEAFDERRATTTDDRAL